MVRSFEFTGMPVIKFGPGYFKRLPGLIVEQGKDVLVISGGSSLKKSGRLDELLESLKDYSIKVFTESVRGEPSPDIVDEIVERYRKSLPGLVVAIGGGSVLDTGKAVSAMLTKEGSVMNYLEGVGAGMVHDGEKVPFIAAPTTSGTGSEATKNAVLSRVGSDGFKKSLRHDNFIPDFALLDPELIVNCPPEITAASGLDTLTQLMGSYTSTEASPLTDSLTLKGIEYAIEAVVPVSTDQPGNLELRTKLAYASLVSGISLANAGLGIVHGLASPVGGFFEIPHGVICGTLLAEAVALNIKLLQEKGGTEADYYLQKYARVGAIISGNSENIAAEKERYCKVLISQLRELVDILRIPRLGEYGVSEADLDRIAEISGNKNNPVQLSREQMKFLMKKRL